MEEESASIQDLFELLSSSDFRDLQAELGRFNPFQVLAIENTEIRHSNVLAWLLYPSESHGLGDAIVRGISSHVVVANDSAPDDFDLENTYFEDFTDAEVLREWQHIDILVVSPRKKTVIIIENKIYSGESRNQLSNYFTAVYKAYPGYRILPIILTIEGHEAQYDERYLGLSHRVVVDIIERELQSHTAVIPTEIESFIKQYLEAVRRLLGMDQKVEQLCHRILKDHNVAIKTLIQVASARRYALDTAASTFAEEHPELLPTWSNNKTAWFAFKDWLPLKGKTEGWNEGFPVALWFCVYYDRLKIVLEVGPIEPPDLRLRLIEHLETEGFRVQIRAKRLESKYTRLFTSHVEVKDWEDNEELESKLNQLYSHDANESIALMTKSVNTFQW